jgi:predicted ATPase
MPANAVPGLMSIALPRGVADGYDGNVNTTGPNVHRVGNLPAQLSSFVGRRRELGQVRRLMAITRLLTLTGPGGMGKTRLALEAARDAVDRYPDGVWLVELAPLTEPLLVAQAVAANLRVRQRPGQLLEEALCDTLESKKLLLLLDNCEHVAPACAELVDRLLRACPSLRILSTSREAVRLPGETTWVVPALAVPPPISPLPSSNS